MITRENEDPRTQRPLHSGGMTGFKDENICIGHADIRTSAFQSYAWMIYVQ